jgi:hypothetical protein
MTNDQRAQTASARSPETAQRIPAKDPSAILRVRVPNEVTNELALRMSLDSAFTPASRITFAHFATSFAMSALNAAGLRGYGIQARSASCSMTVGCCRKRSISAFSDDRRGRCRGREQSLPRDRFVSRERGNFGDRGNLGRELRSLCARHREHPQLAGLRVRTPRLMSAPSTFACV